MKRTIKKKKKDKIGKLKGIIQKEIEKNILEKKR